MSRKSYMLILMAILILCFQSRDDVYFQTRAQPSASTPISTNQTDNAGINILFHEININIHNTSEITITELYKIHNLRNSSLSGINIWLNRSVDDISITDYEGSVVFTKENYDVNNNLLKIKFKTPLNFTEKETILIAYTHFFTFGSSSDSPYAYVFETSISHFTEIFKLIIWLPPGYGLYRNEENPEHSSYLPTYNAKKTTIDERTIISWERINYNKENNQAFLVQFIQKPYEINPEGGFAAPRNSFIAGIILGVFLGVSFTFWLIRYREKKAIKETGKSLLAKDQKELIRIVFEHKGKISQKQLCDVTGYSKSKISRNLVPLEKRGLITREKWGRTYVVHLTETGRTVVD